MGSKNSPAGSTTTTTNQSPWAPQQPYLTNIFNQAQNLYGTGGPAYTPYPTYAPLTNTGISALDQLSALGTQGSPVDQPSANADISLMGGATNANDPGIAADKSLLAQGNIGTTAPGTSEIAGMASGNYLNGGAQNPYTQALTQNIESSVTPSVESQFIQGGDLSSPSAAYSVGQGVTNALAPTLFSNYQTQEQLAQSAQNQLAQQQLAGGQLQSTEAGNLGSLFNTGAQNQLGALALAPQTQQLPYTDLSQAINAQGLAQQNSQNTLNALNQQYNYNATLPWQNLNEMIGQVTGNYGGTTTQTQPYYENTGANVASGALGGAALGNSLFSAGGLLGGSGVSAGAGKGLGSLLGAGLAFSDRRLKEDIQKLAILPSGLTVYSFRYIGDPEIHIGFMADEVEGVRPEAVVTGPLGFKMVDTAAAADG